MKSPLERNLFFAFAFACAAAFTLILSLFIPGHLALSASASIFAVAACAILFFMTRAMRTQTIIQSAGMKDELARRDLRLARANYENAVLKEIMERINPSLETTETLEIISGSLTKIIPASMVSYCARDAQNKLAFKCHLEEPVGHGFTDEVKKKTINLFSLLSGAHIKEEEVSAACFGAVSGAHTEKREPVRTLFHLPMTVNGALAGIITVASTRQEPYREEEVAPLYAIVKQAGTAIGTIKNLIFEETSKVRATVASLAEGIIMMSVQPQEIAIINAKAKEILGLAGKAEVSLLDVVQALWGKLDFRTAAERVLASRATEIFPGLSSGNIFYKITAGPVKNAREEIIGVAFIFSDITREREIDKMKSEFISTTSHQLRTPLSSMKWFMEMLLSGELGILPEKQKSVLTDVHNSNERVITLVNDLLDVSRIESGKIMLEPTPTDLIDFFKSMLPEVAQNFKKRNQTFTFIKPESLPRISVDPRLIWQVVQNLLTNASKYTPENGTVSLELSLEKKDMLIQVTDNGYGIPEFQKHRVFEKFFRADNISKMEGTGLGLYIAKEIAEASGGRLRFTSAEGKGTSFYFTIPLAGSKRAIVGATI